MFPVMSIFPPYTDGSNDNDMLKMNPITVRIVNINIGKEKTSLLDCGCPKEGQERNPFQV